MFILKKILKLYSGKTITLAPPPEVSLNKNNISIMKKAISDGKKRNVTSFYSEFENSPYWSFLDDGIRNFSAVVDGIYI